MGGPEETNETELDTATGETGAQFPAPRDDLPLIGARYQVLGMLGGGGMGNVYLAHDTELDEDVAVKLLKATYAARPEQVDLLRREVKFARRVTHPNVLRTFDIGSHEGSKFITMELVVGRTLADDLTGPLPFAEVARVARAVSAGLGAAHDAGVLHRDLKPSNVLLAEDGRILLSDFGIAHLVTGAEAIRGMSGTPGYMAPEVLADEPVDLRADVWSLGALLFEMLTGTRLFRGRREGLFQPLLVTPPDPSSLRPEVPIALDRVVSRCLARRPAARFAHPREVIAAFDAALPTPSSTVLAAGAPSRRRARIVAVLPFENRGGPADAHLGEGISALLIDALATGPLRATSRGAIEAAGTIGRSPAEVGRDVGAEAVVTGSIANHEGNVAIELAVTGTADGLVLFRETLACALEDLVGAAERMSRALANALLVVRKEGELERHDAAALDLYLKGSHLFRRRWGNLVDEAKQCLREALARAPDDPMILSAYASALAFGMAAGDAADEAEARRATERALEIARDRPEPHLAAASLGMQIADNAAAARAIGDALAIAPHHPQAHYLRGLLLLETTGTAEGLAHFYTAVTVDPTLTHARWYIALAHALAGEHERSDAILGAATAPERAGSDYWVNRMRCVYYRPTPERRAALAAELAATPDFSMKAAVVATFDLVEGRARTDATMKTALAVLGKRSNRRISFGACVDAEVAAILGADDRVVQAVAQMDAAGSVDVVWLDRAPLLDRVRARPEVQAIRARVEARAAEVRAALGSARATSSLRA
ncbi:MAG: protein kinase [Labilithrix sp.]|nr:protein kinase [Labilithrix sp.]MCW5816982.1 protein kinase [Labilithrix sp.]